MAAESELQEVSLVSHFGGQAKETAMTTAPATFTIFMLVRTTPTWLALPPEQRFAFFREHIVPVLAKRPQVTMRFFESEAFNSEVTDILAWETTDLMAWQAIAEDLRETRFWGHYFEIVSILPAIENAYARHYGDAALTG
jgi:chlorite dismutase